MQDIDIHFFFRKKCLEQDLERNLEQKIDYMILL